MAEYKEFLNKEVERLEDMKSEGSSPLSLHDASSSVFDSINIYTRSQLHIVKEKPPKKPPTKLVKKRNTNNKTTVKSLERD